jgi:hypothetical protein
LGNVGNVADTASVVTRQRHSEVLYLSTGRSCDLEIPMSSGNGSEPPDALASRSDKAWSRAKLTADVYKNHTRPACQGTQILLGVTEHTALRGE